MAALTSILRPSMMLALTSSSSSSCSVFATDLLVFLEDDDDEDAEEEEAETVNTLTFTDGDLNFAFNLKTSFLFTSLLIGTLTSSLSFGATAIDCRCLFNSGSGIPVNSRISSYVNSFISSNARTVEPSALVS